MKRRVPTTVLSIAVGLGLLWFSAGSQGQLRLATGQDANVTDDGLHRVHPSIMEAAWVKPDFDLSSYTRVLLMPTAVQFRDVREGHNDARTRANTEEFPLTDERQEWLRGLWTQAVESRFAQEDALEYFDGDESNVLVVQGFLVDVVSRIPSDISESTYILVSNPWSVFVVLELRDAATAELLARTVDQRNAQGLLEVGAAWHQTEGLVDRWADVLTNRLDQLSDLGGRPSSAPAWWAPSE